MSDEKPHFAIQKQLPTCSIRGRSGRFFLLRTYRRRARVAHVETPGTKGFLINKAALYAIEEVHPDLFPASPESKTICPLPLLA